MTLSLVAARILSLFFTSICAGVHLTTLALALWTLLCVDLARGKATRWLIIVSVCMGIVGVLDVSVNAALNVRVWRTNNTSLFTDVSLWMNRIKDADQCIQILIGDGIMIYRCWLIYERDWLAIAFSTVIWITTLIVSILFNARTTTIDPSNGVNASSLTSLTIPLMSLTAVLNAITTALIVLRIWRTSRRSRAYTQTPTGLPYVMRLLIEAGALYTFTAVITLATEIAKSSAVYITSDCLVQITGITFNLLIIRFKQNLVNESSVKSQIPYQLSSSQPMHRALASTEMSHMPVALEYHWHRPHSQDIEQKSPLGIQCDNCRRLI
ncbi:hypothetical protein CERSUDRAFT_118851 [Gelatoporia subvermispora B]|uniref:Uncharacterized protein n=1 Tax=Ceriporiopsis subvermispora (strain B) TaxID=914234 RepID=M2R027_CERS8|nr:hypothetical protein CERSUDRAFT_118851 [Gelatoporia subvermispora B]